jgi:hypothetical protein
MARNMIARGKREARRPWVANKNLIRALKVRNISAGYSALSELHRFFLFVPGATRLALLGACPWLSYFAPSALPQMCPSRLGRSRKCPFRAWGAPANVPFAPGALPQMCPSRLGRSRKCALRAWGAPANVPFALGALPQMCLSRLRRSHKCAFRAWGAPANVPSHLGRSRKCDPELGINAGLSLFTYAIQSHSYS